MNHEPIPLMDQVSLDDLNELAQRAGDVVSELRNSMLLPDAIKIPPMLSGDKVAELCGLTKGQMAYRVGKGAPGGQVGGRGGRRVLSVEEAQVWARQERKEKLRPAGCTSTTIAVAFFKGGVTKTTTSMVLAQGLSLLGHRVLNIDLDPQGSLTTLHGILPDSDLDETQTLAPLFHGDETDVRYAIQKSYWPNIDIIPSASSLFGAEFSLPSRQMRDSSFKFWDVLNSALDSVRDEYDVIIIDTPPSLSYMTLNAFFAADGILVPMTTNMLDMASSAQFFKLFSEFATQLSHAQSTPKTYEFVNVILSKVDNQDTTTRAVREWIQTVFGARVMPVEIPHTKVASNQVNQFRTAFDVTKYEGDARTYARARDAYEAFALAMEESVRRVWERQLQARSA